MSKFSSVVTVCALVFSVAAMGAEKPKSKAATSAPAASAPSDTGSMSMGGSSGDSMMWAGALIGMMKPDITGADDAMIAFGANVGYKFNPEWGVGAYFLYGKKSTTVLTTTSETTVMPFGLEGSWFHDSGFNAGVRVGLSSVKNTTTGQAEFNKSTMHFGPRAGYDYVFSPGWSAGIDASYLLHMEKKENNVVVLESFNAITAVAALKYWF